MIPFDFIYCRPDTLQEAIQEFTRLQSQGENPVYYAGGSEIITMSRAGSIHPGAVIDIKKIPECAVLSAGKSGIDFGAACTLSRIADSKLFPLLTLACGRIADHTNQCRITLGGNLCGTIIYRETSLPLLISDAEITLLGSRGLRTLPFEDLFSGRLKRRPEELVVSVHIPPWAPKAQHYHIKKAAQEKIDYPLVSVSAIKADGGWRLALSGVCAYPFRSREMEAVFNDTALSAAHRAEKMAELLPEPIYSDIRGSGEYRLFVLKNTLRGLLEDIADDFV